MSAIASARSLKAYYASSQMVEQAQLEPVLTEEHYLRAESGDQKAIRFIAMIYLVGGPGIDKDLTLAAYYMRRLADLDRPEAEGILVRRANYLCDEFHQPKNAAIPVQNQLKQEIHAVSQMLHCFTDFYTSFYERHAMTTRSRSQGLSTALSGLAKATMSATQQTARRT
jgi:hypothetical protein